jgi:cytochrome c-type biogenesis protein CcsB
MVNQGLAQTSDTLFWAALAAYAVAMVLFFAALAYRARRIGSVAAAIAWIGVLIHVGSVTTRGLAAGRVPWGNMFEYSSMLGLLLVATYLVVVDRRLGLRQIGGFALAAGVLALASARMLYAPAEPLQPALESYWLRFHVFAAISGSMLFGLSFIFSVLSLIKARGEHRNLTYGGSTVGAAYVGTRARDADSPVEDLINEPRPGASIRDGGGFRGRLPDAERLETLAYRTVQFAFPIWTFAVIAGAIWAHEAWGRYWGWDPKETWAFVTWVIYAGYLHAHATAGWRARRAAWINVAGFASVLTTYYLVNLVMASKHGYAGV